MRVYNFDLTRFAKQFKNANFKRIVSNKQNFINLLSEKGYIVNLIIKKDKDDLIYGSFSRTLRTKGTFYDILTIKGDSPHDDFYAVTENNNEYFIEKQEKTPDIEEEFDFKDKNSYLENTIKKQKEIVLLDTAIVFNGRKDIKISIEDDVLTSEEEFFYEDMVGNYLKVDEKVIEIKQVLSEKSIKFYSKSYLKEKDYEGFSYLPTEFINLDYLENEKISILADGGVLEEKIVKDGKIELDNPYETAIFGIKYEGIIITQPLSLNALDTFLTKNIQNVFLRLKNTKNFFVGFKQNELEQVSFTGYAYKNNQPIPLYTGDIELNLKTSGWNSFTRLYIKNTLPTPVNLSGIYYEASIIQ